jgi:hypothetical protein
MPVHAMTTHGGGGGNYSSTHRCQMEVGGHYHAAAALPQEITWVTIEKGQRVPSSPLQRPRDKNHLLPLPAVDPLIVRS